MIAMPVLVQVEMIGLEEVNRNIDRIDRRFKVLSPDEFADQVVATARGTLRSRYVRSRSGQRTGALEAGIVKIDAGPGKVIVTASALSEKGFDYAARVENGRRAISVPYPLTKMKFIGRNGEPVFTRHVSETEPKKFMAEARAFAKRFFAEYMRRRVYRIAVSNGTADINPQMPQYGGTRNVNASFGEHIHVSEKGKKVMKVVRSGPGHTASVRKVGRAR